MSQIAAMPLGSGQELSNISYDNPAYTIIFLIVGHNGEVFSFLNKTSARYEFLWKRWSSWREILTPYSVHAFLVQTYNTKSGTGQGFTPVQHLIEFTGIKEGRVFNAYYLEQYMRWKDHADAEHATRESIEFAAKLVDLGILRVDWNRRVMNDIKETFDDDVLKANVAFAMEAQNFELDMTQILDCGPIAEALQAWEDPEGLEAE